MTTMNTAPAVPDERAALAAEIGADPHRARMSLQEWYLLTLSNCAIGRLRVKEQAAKMMAQFAAVEKAVEWRWGKEFRELVVRDLEAQAKGKSKPKKSIDYITGRAGFRSTRGSLVIKDPAALEAWAVANKPELLKLQISKTAVSEYIKGTGEVPPGAEWIMPAEKFYPSSEVPELPEGEDQ